MEAAWVVRRNNGDGSRLYGRGCFSFGGLVSSHLPNLFHSYCRANGWLMCKNSPTCFFYSSLCPLHLHAQTASKGFGQGQDCRRR